MADIHIAVDIKRPPEAVFDMLADILHYSRWLPPSNSYNETTDVSSSPIRMGTTYIDRQTSGLMYGQVSEYKPYSRLAFHQANKRRWLGLDITILYELTETDQGTHLERTTTAVPLGLMRLLQLMAVTRVTQENQRTLEALKTYLEEDHSSVI